MSVQHALPGARLMVGSGMKKGDWSGDGWHEKEEEVVEVPATLQQINADDLHKVGASSDEVHAKTYSRTAPPSSYWAAVFVPS